ncbi:MAG: TIGR02206 family membrane protein, partial [Gammaproteobacteria bacterium]
MNQLVLLSPSHIITVCLSLAAIVYIPRLFKDSSDKAKRFLAYLIIFLLLVNQVMDFYREGIMSE